MDHTNENEINGMNVNGELTARILKIYVINHKMFHSTICCSTNISLQVSQKTLLGTFSYTQLLQ